MNARYQDDTKPFEVLAESSGIGAFRTVEAALGIDSGYFQRHPRPFPTCDVGFDHQGPKELAAAVNKAKTEYIGLNGVTMGICSLQCLSLLGKTFRQRLLSFRRSEEK